MSPSPSPSPLPSPLPLPVPLPLPLPLPLSPSFPLLAREPVLDVFLPPPMFGLPRSLSFGLNLLSD
ncbi:hypothetical protein E0H64_23740 [Rhizobium leguminosarum bv. viciae]|nr:hypothetical protein E0H64_23740 [Rhizobium leguminosarum bv. viciae]